MADRVDAARERFFEADLAACVGLDAVFVALLPDGRHQQQRHEERDGRDDLARRQLLRAECLPQQAEHDDDPHEAGGHQQDRRREADDRQQQHDLHRRGEALRAGPVLRSADADRKDRGSGIGFGGDGGGRQQQDEAECYRSAQRPSASECVSKLSADDQPRRAPPRWAAYAPAAVRASRRIVSSPRKP